MRPLFTSMCALASVMANTALAAPIISGSYYEERISGTVCSTTSCAGLFSGIGAGHSVTSKQIDCLVAGSKFKPMYALLQIKDTPRYFYMGVDKTGDDGDYNYYHFSYSGPLLLAGNPLVAIAFGHSAGDITLSCSMIGSFK